MAELTVLMPVYNGLPYLPQALESVLGQTMADFELLVIDDASTDGSREVVRGFRDGRIRLVENPGNIHHTRTVNRGLDLCRTEFVVRMDADDISHPTRFEKMIDFLRCNSNVAVLGSNLRWIDASGNVTGVTRRPLTDAGIRWAHLFSCEVGGGCVMMRRSIVWERLRGYDAFLRFGADWELWSRVHESGFEMANLREPLLDVRIHPESCTVRDRDMVAKEVGRVRRRSRLRILSGGGNVGEWMKPLEECIRRRNEHPSFRLGIYDVLYRRFCECYPRAAQHAEVQLSLFAFYREVIRHTNIRTIPVAMSALRRMIPAWLSARASGLLLGERPGGW